MDKNENSGNRAEYTELGKRRIALNSLRRETVDSDKNSKENNTGSDVRSGNAHKSPNGYQNDDIFDFYGDTLIEDLEDDNIISQMDELLDTERIRAVSAESESPIDFSSGEKELLAKDLNDITEELDIIGNQLKKTNDITEITSDSDNFSEVFDSVLNEHKELENEKSKSRINKSTTAAKKYGNEKPLDNRGDDKNASEKYRAEMAKYNANASAVNSETNGTETGRQNGNTAKDHTDIIEKTVPSSKIAGSKKTVSDKKGLEWLAEESKRSESKVDNNIDLIFGGDIKAAAVQSQKPVEKQVKKSSSESNINPVKPKKSENPVEKPTEELKKAVIRGRVTEEPLENTASYDTSKIFADSVKTLKSKDIPLSAPPKSATSAFFTRNNIKTMLLVFFIVVFLASAGQLVYIVIDHIKAEQMYSDIDKEINQSESIATYTLRQDKQSKEMLNLETAQFADISEDDYTANDNESYNYVSKLKGKVNYYRERNDDVCGYIIVPNTRIDYPVLYSGDNEFYLDHDFLGNFRLAGAIFMDYRNSRDFTSNYNTCIYGHNLAGGTMFNNITMFLDANFFAQNKYIELINSDGLYTYEVFAAYKTDMYDNYIQTSFSSGEEFVEFAYEMKSRSYNEREGIEFTEDDCILTLSTCTNVVQEERYTIQAKLVKVQ